MTLRHYLPAFLLAFLEPSAKPVYRVASYYADEYEGVFMANGERFSQEGMTCASNDFTLGTWLLLTYQNQTIRVRVTDRMDDQYTGRRIDLTKTAFRRLRGTLRPGIMSVRVNLLGN